LSIIPDLHSYSKRDVCILVHAQWEARDARVISVLWVFFHLFAYNKSRTVELIFILFDIGTLCCNVCTLFQFRPKQDNGNSYVYFCLYFWYNSPLTLQYLCRRVK
jgi:hypothetical protein